MSSFDESVASSKAISLSSEHRGKKSRASFLPWDEEILTFSHKKGSTLLKLQRENAELRKKLKQFNARINDLIEKTARTVPKKHTKEANPEDVLETANNKLKNYE